MKVIFMLIALFVLACVFYGIYAGISANGRGAARLGGHQHHPRNPNTPSIQPLPASTATQPKRDRGSVAELQALFALHQSGALTLGEFEHLKQRLLAETH